MARSRRKEIQQHRSETEIDALLRDAEDEHRLRRLAFVKNLYRGDTIPEAADRVGRSAATGDRWADDWNAGGMEALMPDFGGGRPPKLDEDDREHLRELLREDQPWTSAAVRELLDAEFDVEYHPDYLGTVLRDLGLSFESFERRAGPERTTYNRADRPDEGPDEREGHRVAWDSDAVRGWVFEADVPTD